MKRKPHPIDPEFAAAPIALQRLIADMRADLDAAIRTAHMWGRGRRARKVAAANGHGGVMTHALALDAARRQATPKKHGVSDYKAIIRANRRATVKRLAKFDPTDPRPGIGKHTAVLVMHGYLVKKGDGYVRTGKEFKV